MRRAGAATLVLVAGLAAASGGEETQQLAAAARAAADGRSTSAAAGPDAALAPPLFSDSFDGADGPVDGGRWDVTSGAWQVRGGRAVTESAVSRAHTRQTTFQNVTVRLDLYNLGLTTPEGEAWHGVHLLLRRVSEHETYALSVNRRDGRAFIKKKVKGPTANGGTYYDLASARYDAPIGRRQRVQSTAINNADGSVTLTLAVDGRRVASATDRGAGGPPIRQAASVGFRGDFASFAIDDVSVTEAEGAAAPAPAPEPAGPSYPAEAKAPQRFLSPARADGVNDAAEFGTDAEVVTVFDSSGRQVARLERAPGGRIVWNCRDPSGRLVGSGVYIAKIRKRDSATAFQSFAVVK